MQVEFEHVTSIAQIPCTQWRVLAEGEYPFVQHEYLQLLETSHSACTDTGWQPFHLLIRDHQKQLLAALPLYIKTHSYGEYVFDWSWADAYRRYGFQYYPKLLSAIPFTPVTGARLLCKSEEQRIALWPLVAAHLEQQCTQLGLSSFHLLFPSNKLKQASGDASWLARQSVQFQWFNRDYRCFEDFTNTFTSRKRKNLKKERNKIIDQGIAVERLSKAQLTTEYMDEFYQFYKQTYLKRSGHEGYLSQAFFTGLLVHLPQNIMLVRAVKNDTAIAGALYFYDETGLYGRYWGSIEEIDALHFECCYYQGIEFCIEHKLPLFNPGTQGEHKIQRGFEPIICHSQHWIVDTQFREAIARFTQQETEHVQHYQKEAATLLPFKASES